MQATRWIALILFVTYAANAETGRDAWLRYGALDERAAVHYRAALPAVVATLDDSELIQSARTELIRGARGMVGRTLRIAQGIPKEDAILLATLDDLRAIAGLVPLGVEGAIVGKALYAGAFTLQEALAAVSAE